MRIGMGYDVHKLVENRDLILGGVKIPYSLGLLGHSDADVLLHAIMDSLLGAAALGDIGKHFPDSDDRYMHRYFLTALPDVLENPDDCFPSEPHKPHNSSWPESRSVKASQHTAPPVLERKWHF